MSKEDLIKDLEKLREEIRPYSDGEGGGYFAAELDEVIQRHTATTIHVGDLIKAHPNTEIEYRVTSIEVLRAPDSDVRGLADFTITIVGSRA
jgi:hypothetical protein